MVLEETKTLCCWTLGSHKFKNTHHLHPHVHYSSDPSCYSSCMPIQISILELWHQERGNLRKFVNQAVEVKICSDFPMKTGWLEKQQIPLPETSLQLIATLHTIRNNVCMILELIIPGFAWAQFWVCWPSLTVRLTACGGIGGAKRRLAVGAAPNLMLLKL